MKREIIFRGKRVVNGEWVEGSYIYDNRPSGGYQIINFNRYEQRCYEVIPETAGQYTGLKDKNGVKIFEGDVVKHKQYISYGTLSEHIGKVTISPSEGVMVGYNSIGEEYEVIGNSHDNPELLGVE